MLIKVRQQELCFGEFIDDSDKSIKTWVPKHVLKECQGRTQLWVKPLRGLEVWVSMELGLKESIYFGYAEMGTENGVPRMKKKKGKMDRESLPDIQD